MELSGRWGSGHAHRAGEGSCHLHLPPCRAVWSSQRGSQAAGHPATVTYSNLHWLFPQMEDTWETLIHHQWIYSPWHTNSLRAATWKLRDQSFLRRRSSEALQCSFCGPHTKFGVHITAPGGKMFLRAPAGLAPTTAECFNKCQGWHERSLSERTDWPNHSRQEAAIGCKMAELLALPRVPFSQPSCSPASHVCSADSYFHSLLIPKGCSWWRVKMTSRHLVVVWHRP